MLGQQFLYVLISYFPILYVLIYTIFSKLWSVDVLFDSAFPNFPICQRLKARSSYGVFVSKLWSFVLFPNYYIRYFPNYGVSMSLFPNYGPLPCSFDWVHKPNRTLTFSTNLIRATLSYCATYYVPFDGGSWGFLWWWVFDCDFFDFWFRTHGMSIHELMGISLISWGRIFLGREPILINSIFLKPFE